MAWHVIYRFKAEKKKHLSNDASTFRLHRFLGYKSICTAWFTTKLVCQRVNSLYMFQALICSSSRGTVYTAIGIFWACYVGWLLAGLAWNWWWANKCSKHVVATNLNNLETNSSILVPLYWHITTHSKQNIKFYRTIVPWNNQLSDHVQYSFMDSRTSNQAWSKGSDAGIYCK
jgi:hypothetical protein